MMMAESAKSSATDDTEKPEEGGECPALEVGLGQETEIALIITGTQASASAG